MRVFIACKPYVETGGIELLHQLAAQLTQRGIEAYIVYYSNVNIGNIGRNPTPQSYEKYGAKVADEYLDAEDSVFILAETFFYLSDLCKKGQMVIWWLSVDNYLKQVTDMKVEYKFPDRAVHFVQSCYAKHYIKENLGITDSYYLSDYISGTIVNYADGHRDLAQRENICLYNPSKGYEHVKRLISKAPHIHWVPIKGLKPEQVAELLCRAKVYIDFGNHPGKDRIPREAAYCGCVIITNRKGSAAFHEDVAIPDNYKITEDESDEQVIEKISELMENYDEKKKDFIPYVEKIQEEKKVFENEVGKMIEFLTNRMLEGTQKEIDKETVIRFLDMMNYQLQNLMNKNNDMKVFVARGEYEKCMTMLLEESHGHRDIKEEIWELLRYFAE